MARIIIHGMSGTTCTRRIATVCKLLGVDYELKAVDKSVLKTPAYFKLQPFGQVPVMEDPETGFFLFGT